MMNDQTTYLNRGPGTPMGHRLLDLIEESKQVKAPAKQWRAWLAGLSQKGVKANELKMSGLGELLEAATADASISKADLLFEASKNMVTIKEVALGTPYFSDWRYKGGDYKEYLYIANSERDCVADEIEMVMWDINDLNFNMEKLMEEPDLLTRLERRLHGLRHMENKAPDFSSHHFTTALSGRHGKNLVAHARVSVHGDLYFMDEIQSDWAQKGRKTNDRFLDRDGRPLTLFETGQVPVGPYVKDTEDWAGLVLRRHAAIAAANPAVTRFGWITGAMRNGGRAVSHDNLDEFYTRIIPKIMDKVIGKAGGKVKMMEVVLDGLTFSVPGFEMTDAVRGRLKEKLPMFSRSSLGPELAPSDELKCRVMKQCGEMLGTLARVRILDRCFDIATGARVAGVYTNKQLLLSEEAANLPYAANHETFHAAMDLMLNDHEREMVLDKFAPGMPLNYAVKNELISSGNLSAAAQCDIAEEAAAHGFALWREDRIEVADKPVAGLFADVMDTMKLAGQWIRKNVFGRGYQSPAEMFDALSNGELAARRTEQLREYHGRHVAG